MLDSYVATCVTVSFIYVRLPLVILLISQCCWVARFVLDWYLGFCKFVSLFGYIHHILHGTAYLSCRHGHVVGCVDH